MEPQSGGRRRGGSGRAAESQRSDCVQGLVSWYGIFDMRPLASQPGANPQRGQLYFLRCTTAGCPEDVVRLASPVSFVDAHTPPALLIHATADKTVNPKQSQDLYDLLKSKGMRVELMMIPAVGHSFIGETHEATRAASLSALDRTFAFIDATLGGKENARAR